MPWGPFLQLLYQQLFWNTKLSPKLWDDYNEKLQGIYQMGLSDPLAGSYLNKYYEKPNFHQNLEIIALKKIAGDELNGT